MDEPDSTTTSASPEEEAELRRAIATFLTDMLGAAAPGEEGKDITVLDLLNRAAASVGTDLADEPAVEARVRETIGSTYLALGEFDPAVNHLQRASELDDAVLGADP